MLLMCSHTLQAKDTNLRGSTGTVMAAATDTLACIQPGTKLLGLAHCHLELAVFARFWYSQA